MQKQQMHLSRLKRTFERYPVYFITCTTDNRREILATDEMHAIACEVWENCRKNYGWSVGPYVLMPDHVHFFAAIADEEAKPLSNFTGKWKEWTAKYANRRLDVDVPVWQPEFFDHILRSTESFREKVTYVWMNPVRAKLVSEAADWRYRGNFDNWLIT